MSQMRFPSDTDKLIAAIHIVRERLTMIVILLCFILGALIV